MSCLSSSPIGGTIGAHAPCLAWELKRPAACPQLLACHKCNIGQWASLSYPAPAPCSGATSSARSRGTSWRSMACMWQVGSEAAGLPSVPPAGCILAAQQEARSQLVRLQSLHSSKLSCATLPSHVQNCLQMVCRQHGVRPAQAGHDRSFPGRSHRRQGQLGWVDRDWAGVGSAAAAGKVSMHSSSGSGGGSSSSGGGGGSSSSGGGSGGGGGLVRKMAGPAHSCDEHCCGASRRPRGAAGRALTKSCAALLA